VQTVKKALLAWTNNITHTEFPVFLQRVLFHHRNSSVSRGKTPAELVFGRQLRVPVTSHFHQGEMVLYKPHKHSSTFQAEFLMSKGQNTAWILKDDQLRLASNNQLATNMSDLIDEESESPSTQPTSSCDTGNYSDTPTNHSDHHKVTDRHQVELPQSRRSARERRKPDRYNVCT
jgi:hypothetical protein